MFDLSGIRFDLAERVIESEMKIDIFTDYSCQHPSHAGNHGIQVKRLWLQHLLAAEGQQLARQRRCAFPGPLDFFDLEAK